MSKRLSRKFRYSVSLLAVSLLAGCAVGPDFHQPAPPEVAGYSPTPLPSHTASAQDPGGAPQHLVQGMDIPGQWWSVFRSPRLDALIAKLHQTPYKEHGKVMLEFESEIVG